MLSAIASKAAAQELTGLEFASESGNLAEQL